MSEHEACVNIIIHGESEIMVKTSKTKAFQALDFLTGRTKLIGNESIAVPNTPLIIPDRAKLENYIRSQADYQYSIEGIVQSFFGREINSTESDEAKRLLNGIRAKVQRIRESIEKEEGGQWVDTPEGRYKAFKFIKSPLPIAPIMNEEVKPPGNEEAKRSEGLFNF